MKLLVDDVEFGSTEQLLSVLVVVQFASLAVTFGENALVYFALVVGTMASILLRWPLSLVGFGIGFGGAAGLVLVAGLTLPVLSFAFAITVVGALGFVVVGAVDRFGKWHYPVPVGLGILAGAVWLVLEGQFLLVGPAMLLAAVFILRPYYTVFGFGPDGRSL
jgi:hypothetical protein